MEKCSVCGGEKGFFGKLGHLVYLKCRNCGMQSIKNTEDYTEKQIGDYTEQDEEDYYEELKER